MVAVVLSSLARVSKVESMGGDGYGWRGEEKRQSDRRADGGEGSAVMIGEGNNDEGDEEEAVVGKIS